MTAIMPPSERCRDVLATASAMEMLTQTLTTCCSNFAPMDPEEEQSFSELWKRLADLQETLENRCHGLPPSARSYFSKKLSDSAQRDRAVGLHCPAESEEEFPWHEARTVTPSKTSAYRGRLADGTDCGRFLLTPKIETTCTKVNDDTPLGLIGYRNCPLPDSIMPVIETRRTLGYELVQESGSVRHGWIGSAKAEYAMPEFQVAKARAVTATGDELHPDVCRGTVLFIDTSVRAFQGRGTYVLDKGRGQTEIAVIQPLNGGFLYTADKATPRTLASLDGLSVLGKAFLFLTAAEES